MDLWGGAPILPKPRTCWSLSFFSPAASSALLASRGLMGSFRRSCSRTMSSQVRIYSDRGGEGGWKG